MTSASDTVRELRVNGETHQVAAEPDTPLLYVLRNDLGLKGTRFGCGVGACGACTVQIDGRAVASCDTPLWAALDHDVLTIEGIGSVEQPHPLQRAFLRETFAAAAARRLGVDPATLTVRDGSFVSATGGSIDYWRLLEEVDLHQEITGNVAPKPSAAYRVVGRSVPRRDLPRKLSGAAYVHDLDLPDMWHGRIVRPPSSDAQLAGVDEEKLRSRVPAVQIVVNGRFVGVVAPREEDALRAIAVAQTAVRWTTPADLPDPSGMVDWLHGHVRDSTELAERSASKPNDTQSFHATYSKPYLAHASIGPACAVAEWARVRRDRTGANRLVADAGKFRAPVAAGDGFGGAGGDRPRHSSGRRRLLWPQRRRRRSARCRLYCLARSAGRSGWSGRARTSWSALPSVPP